MTETLYLGDIVTKGTTTTIDPILMPIVDRSITIRPAEPYPKDLKYYLDLLYYNRVNALGDILTSLVYVSDFRDSSPDVTFNYKPDLMFRHNTAETYIDVADDDTDFSGYNYIKQHDKLPLYSEPSNYEILLRNGKLSNTLGPIDIAFDGWYTVLTVGVTDRGFIGVDGELTWIDPNNYVPYQVKEDPGNPNTVIGLNNFSNTDLSVGQLPYNSTIYNTYKKLDFFVVYDFKKLYTIELEREAELNYRASYNSIIEKGKVLDYLLSTKDFMTAQKLLQTVEDSVLLNVLT